MCSLCFVCDRRIFVRPSTLRWRWRYDDHQLNRKMLTKFSWERPQPDRQTSLLSDSVARKFPANISITFCGEKISYLWSEPSSKPTLAKLWTIIIVNKIVIVWSLSSLSHGCHHLVEQPTQSRLQDHIFLLVTSDSMIISLSRTLRSNIKIPILKCNANINILSNDQKNLSKTFQSNSGSPAPSPPLLIMTMTMTITIHQQLGNNNTVYVKCTMTMTITIKRTTNVGGQQAPVQQLTIVLPCLDLVRGIPTETRSNPASNYFLAVPVRSSLNYDA